MKKSLFSYETFTVHVIRFYHAVAVTRVQLCFQYSQRLKSFNRFHYFN